MSLVLEQKLKKAQAVAKILSGILSLSGENVDVEMSSDGQILFYADSKAGLSIIKRVLKKHVQSLNLVRTDSWDSTEDGPKSYMVVTEPK